MIAIELAFLQFLAPFALFSCAVAMVVLRAGASRVFFDIVGTFQASKLIKDAESASIVLQALWLDSITSIQESGGELLEVFTNLADEVVPIARNIEEARIQFDKFLSEAERTGDIFHEIEDVGAAFGFAADDAYNAASRMAQLAGVLGGGTTAVGTEIGMVFGLISGMETQEGMQRLINLQQQTKFMTDGIRENATAEERRQMIYRNSIQVLDELNTVENRSAATMSQITYVMNQFASQAHLTGESIAAMAAMSATLIEAGEEQGKGGRALRMIYARLGANTNGAADAIKALGIEVIDTETGAMRPFSDILEDLSVKYEKMNGQQQQALAQGIAGNRHYTRLIKLLENVDRVRELEGEAIEGLFPAMDEAERRRETELFQLEQMEARLENYQSALGDQLLPVLTEVTRTQVIFTDTLVQLYEGPIGPLAKAITEVGYGFKQFVGPLMNTIILLYNAKIAFGTYIAIQKSMNEVVLSGEHAYKNQIGQLIENTIKLRIYNTELRELRKSYELFHKEQIKGVPLSQEEYDRQDKFLQKNRQVINSLKDLRDKKQWDIDLTKRQKAGLTEHIDLIKNESLPVRKKANQQIIDDMVKEGASHKELEERREKNLYLTDRLVTKMNRLHFVLEKLPKDYDDLQAEIDEFNRQIEKEEEKARRREERQAAYKARKRMEEAENQSEKLRELQAEAEAYNSLTLQLGIAGSGLMLLADSEFKQRMGMLLNSAAIGVQVWAMMQKQKTMILNIMAGTKELKLELAKTAATNTNTAAVAANTAATSGWSLAATQARIASFAVARGLSATAAAAVSVAVPLAAIVVLAGAVAWSFKKSTKEVESFTASIVDFDEAARISAEQTLPQITAELEKQKQIREDLLGIDTEEAKRQLEVAETKIGNLQHARDIELFAQGGMLDYYTELANAIETVDSTQRAYTDLLADGADERYTKKANERYTAALKVYNDLVAQNDGESFDLLLRYNLVDAEEWNIDGTILPGMDPSLTHEVEKGTDILTRLIGSAADEIAKSNEDVTEEWNDIIDNSLGKMYEFTNAREEMFYGFSTDRLTGDLVRQVHQQGVETLITTTEVIMTNTFNGMTVPEVAQQILDEIESQGNLRGFDFAVN